MSECQYQPIDYREDIKEFRKDIKEIKELLSKNQIEVGREIARIEINLGKSVSKLEVKSGVWGLLGGLIPVIITIFTILLSMKM